MNRNTAKIKIETWLGTALCALLATGGIRVFLSAFPAWRVVPYFLSVILMALCFAMTVYMQRKNRESARPVRAALISGGAFLALAFAAVYLVNNVILGANRAETAAAVMGAAFAVFFLIATAAVLFTSKEKAWVKAVSTLLCAVFLASAAVPGLRPLLPARYEHPFVDRITETKGAGNVAKENKLIINADDSHWWGFWNTLAENGTFDDEHLGEYVMNYADSGVTDLLFNIFCQSSDTPTDVMTFRGDLYSRTEQ
nr:hypothetical protein [Clostridiales bacterium]